ncbi:MULTISPECIES: tRNA (adenosine(37)-N6)-threonylcarbamoyltransferase complex dimerization subunit type 1 TsaB [unclassified Rhizobium]|uniref:tRNA (adenosine(37)-N6)-threonylcarbamoyltransferase complex dimerization subunit type 1 TsaB n=1 Tax=unclassified Rhizobium TaxID=2613769 RepID=UPI001ADBFB8F|nr:MULTISPECIES: tRNA (adenosine(37)-N6)-threonylcarbamoyltransferase complex dimerization subunit type 1 TsaB [unclassified Rhizobium]MBO9097101.1 tRNA (adenosine(37)-N6)-threonylcarbamoyltransferase complex dimerization subunit type 1 TsaB [Rhizobium sp. L58/93]MBO9134047.1 tRNA (adenosine(37)-N6)-threonylcarbamoyltransferase complex dimerization subunit type 1 TsaB [Rhizobium sp. B209b/85]MBO9167339.1 tRNA (adenosine(37)-N6)-threonylcarbamoyltransferase complex dimerization subunit type 1 Tsa
MIVLALDTAGTDCAAAVYDSDGDRVFAEITETIGKGHAEHLIALVDRVLDKAGLKLDAVERIAVTVGPGSFTGIRVGVAAARGFALALGIPAVGVTTLEVIAAAHRPKAAGRPMLVAMDAKRGEVYLQTFGVDGMPLSESAAVLVEDARALAAEFDGLLAGSAVPLLSSTAEDVPADAAGNAFPISDVARLGAKMLVGEKPKPLYLRGPDAKPQLGFAVARQ